MLSRGVVFHRQQGLPLESLGFVDTLCPCSETITLLGADKLRVMCLYYISPAIKGLTAKNLCQSIQIEIE